MTVLTALYALVTVLTALYALVTHLTALYALVTHLTALYALVTVLTASYALVMVLTALNTPVTVLMASYAGDGSDGLVRSSSRLVSFQSLTLYFFTFRLLFSQQAGLPNSDGYESGFDSIRFDSTPFFGRFDSTRFEISRLDYSKIGKR